MKKIFLSLLSILVSTSVFGAGGKYALIIGNDVYDGDFASLSTCVNDALEMDKCLKALGYTTIVLKNATREEMMEAMKKFESNADNISDTGVFFYSGHAVTMNGEPYVIPAKTDIRRGNGFLKEECVGVTSISKIMKNKCLKSILFLDACRNIVYGETKGASGWTTPVSSSSSNFHEQIICFATALDDVARPGQERLSPFTEVLTSHLFDEASFQDIWNKCIVNEVKAKSGQNPTWEGTFSNLFYFKPLGEKIIPNSKPAETPYYGSNPAETKPYAVPAFEIEERFKEMALKDILSYARKAFGEDAVSAYQAAVVKGDKHSYSYLGDIYYNGSGVAISRSKALSYYRMLPDDAHCLFRIAQMQLYGWGGEEKNRTKGKELLQKAISAGSDEAKSLYDKEFGGMN